MTKKKEYTQTQRANAARVAIIFKDWNIQSIKSATNILHENKLIQEQKKAEKILKEIIDLTSALELISTGMVVYSKGKLIEK